MERSKELLEMIRRKLTVAFPEATFEVRGDLVVHIEWDREHPDAPTCTEVDKTLGLDFTTCN